MPRFGRSLQRIKALKNVDALKVTFKSAFVVLERFFDYT